MLGRIDDIRFSPRIEANDRIMTQFEFNSGITSELESDDLKIEDTEWHNIIITFNSSSGEIKHYLDGILKHTYTGFVGDTFVTSTADFQIGFPVSRFEGSISNVRLYNRTLTAGEASKIARLKL